MAVLRTRESKSDGLSGSPIQANAFRFIYFLRRPIYMARPTTPPTVSNGSTPGSGIGIMADAENGNKNSSIALVRARFIYFSLIVWLGGLPKLVFKLPLKSAQDLYHHCVFIIGTASYSARRRLDSALFPVNCKNCRHIAWLRGKAST